MTLFYAANNPSESVGVDIRCTDGPKREDDVSIITGLAQGEVQEWFTSHPPNPIAAIRLVCTTATANRPASSVAIRASTPMWPGAELPFTEAVTSHAVWDPQVYTQLAANRSGGCAALLDEPCRFILQTPHDGGPFVSLALTKRGIVVKGTYVYSHPSHFNPSQVVRDEKIMSGWRGTGLQIVVLPQAVAKAHAGYISSQLDRIVDEITNIEYCLASYNVETGLPSTGCGAWTRALQSSSKLLLDLERRARFQQQVFTAIEQMVTASRQGTLPWAPLAPLKSQLESWQADFDTLPRRIENARSTIITLIQQHNEQLNLQTLAVSHQMAEAALRDNATMKTIAILTMVFLPATAVASVLSMSFFDWSAEKGSELSSKWVWIYFVVAVPLTVIVMLAWYWWAAAYERSLASQFGNNPLHSLSAASAQDDTTATTVLQSVHIGTDADEKKIV